MTMLEKAARAAQEAGPNSCVRGLSVHEAARIARAVLMAVREPGLEVRNVCRFSTAEIEWPRMIDAILDGK